MVCCVGSWLDVHFIYLSFQKSWCGVLDSLYSSGRFFLFSMILFIVRLGLWLKFRHVRTRYGLLTSKHQPSYEIIFSQLTTAGNSHIHNIPTYQLPTTFSLTPHPSSIPHPNIHNIISVISKNKDQNLSCPEAIKETVTE